jgi:hypothetical protein
LLLGDGFGVEKLISGMSSMVTACDRGNCNQRRLAGVLHVNGLSLKGGLGWGVNVPPIS